MHRWSVLDMFRWSHIHLHLQWFREICGHWIQFPQECRAYMEMKLAKLAKKLKRRNTLWNCQKILYEKYRSFPVKNLTLSPMYRFTLLCCIARAAIVIAQECNEEDISPRERWKGSGPAEQLHGQRRANFTAFTMWTHRAQCKQRKQYMKQIQGIYCQKDRFCLALMPWRSRHSCANEVFWFDSDKYTKFT